MQYDTFQRSICLPENNARYGPVEKKNLTQAIPKLKTTLLQNIFWSFFCNEIVRAFSFDCDTCHAKSKKKEQKRLEKSYKKKITKKKILPKWSLCLYSILEPKTVIRSLFKIDDDDFSLERKKILKNEISKFFALSL